MLQSWKAACVMDQVETGPHQAGRDWRETMGEIAARPGKYYCLALRISGSPALAEEAVQEAFARVLNSPPRHCHPESLRGYLFQTVGNIARNQLCAASRQRNTLKDLAMRPPSALPSPQEGFLSQEQAEILRAALARLPLGEREATSLCCEHGLSHLEAANILKIPVRTVSHRVQRGLNRIRAVLIHHGYAAILPNWSVGTLPCLGLPPVPPTLSEKLIRLCAEPPAAPVAGTSGRLVRPPSPPRPATAFTFATALTLLALPGATLLNPAPPDDSIPQGSTVPLPAVAIRGLDQEVLLEDDFRETTPRDWWEVLRPRERISFGPADSRAPLRLSLEPLPGGRSGRQRVELTSRLLPLEGRALVVEVARSGSTSFTSACARGVELLDAQGNRLALAQKRGPQVEFGVGDPGGPFLLREGPGSSLLLTVWPQGTLALQSESSYGRPWVQTLARAPEAVRVRLFVEGEIGAGRMAGFSKVTVTRMARPLPAFFPERSETLLWDEDFLEEGGRPPVPTRVDRMGNRTGKAEKSPASWLILRAGGERRGEATAPARAEWTTAPIFLRDGSEACLSLWCALPRIVGKGGDLGIELVGSDGRVVDRCSLNQTQATVSARPVPLSPFDPPHHIRLHPDGLVRYEFFQAGYREVRIPGLPRSLSARLYVSALRPGTEVEWPIERIFLQTLRQPFRRNGA